MQTLILRLGIFLLRRVRFRLWAKLEDAKRACKQAVEDGNPNFSHLLVDHLSTALYLKVDFSKVFWVDTVKAFYKLHDVIPVVEGIPLIARGKDAPEAKKEPWDYDTRRWYYYCSAIASRYGWSEKEIANLDVNDALAYVQEILTSQYLEREFVWSTTEVAYKYDKTKQVSKYEPLPKPYFMQLDIEAKHARDPVPIPKHLMPVGVVILPPKHETK